MSAAAIPFLDLNTMHKQYLDEFKHIFAQVAETGRFIGGPMVENFEHDFAQFCTAKHCVGVNSGTDALRFALAAADFKPGEVVLTVPNTFIATTEAVTQAGGTIDFIDIDEKTYTIDIDKLQHYIKNNCEISKNNELISKKHNKKVAVIIPVHLYGQTASMDPIMEIARTYNLFVLEDACQAHGAEYFSEKDNCWKKAGSIGDAAAFSFYPGKNLGAFGEGGAVTTNNESIAQKVRILRDHGQARKYIHQSEGYNGRLDALQAGILNVKLKYLPHWNEKRFQCAQMYNSLFEKNNSVITPHIPQWAKPVFHLYIIRVHNREKLQQYLTDQNIGTGLHYPIPLHLQDAYAHLHYKKGDFPVTEMVSDEILSLPMFPDLTREQQERVVNAIADFQQ